jgi:hypothetical protein
MEVAVTPSQSAIKTAKRTKRLMKFWFVMASGGMAVVLLQQGVYPRNDRKMDRNTAISSISDTVVTPHTADSQAR